MGKICFLFFSSSSKAPKTDDSDQHEWNKGQFQFLAAGCRVVLGGYFKVKNVYFWTRMSLFKLCSLWVCVYSGNISLQELHSGPDFAERLKCVFKYYAELGTECV